MAWIRHRLRDADVWARVDDQGALVKDAQGRVEIVYKATAGARVYRAGARNLAPATTGDTAPIEIEVGEPAPERTDSAQGVPASGSRGRAAAGTGPSATVARPDAIHVWTDGACEGNPGPAGLGVVIVDGKEHRELSEYLGQGTNNIAELTAILRGLESIADRKRPVIVYSDSQYSIGLLTQNWKAKANVELVSRLRGLTREFADLRFVKVAAHSGIPLNERVDELARGAISRAR
ncbi:MAG TPA: ribonuclease H [Kofleriaceae bacterium]|nr:ribonuclease H [Kofleriaceae bacterium]